MNLLYQKEKEPVGTLCRDPIWCNGNALKKDGCRGLRLQRAMKSQLKRIPFAVSEDDIVCILGGHVMYQKGNSYSPFFLIR